MSALPDTGPAVAGRRVDVRWDGPVAHVVIGGGVHRNALRREDWTALRAAFTRIVAAPGTRCVTVRGRGGHFCSGSDLTSWAGADQATVHATFAEMEEAFRAVERCPVPVVAVVEGAAAGAGCQLALACDLRVVTEGSSLGMPTAALGILPSPAFAARLVALCGTGRARELLYTGRMVPGREAADRGLAEVCVPAEELAEAVTALVGSIVVRPPEVVAASKAVVDGLSPVARADVRAAGAPTVVHAVMQRALARYAR